MEPVDSVLLKSEIETLKADVVSVFTSYGEIRPNDYIILKNTCLTLSIEPDLLDALIVQVEQLLKTKNTTTQYLIHWVQNLYVSFELDSNFCCAKTDQTQLYKTAQPSTEKSPEALAEIFSYIQNQHTQKKSANHQSSLYTEKPKSSTDSKLTVSIFGFIFVLLIVLLIYILNQQSQPLDSDDEPLRHNEINTSELATKLATKPTTEHSAEQSATPLDETQIDTLDKKAQLLARLRITVSPKNSKITILDTLNTTKTYKADMLLPYGEYQIEVASEGFESLKISVILKQEQQVFSFTLRKNLPHAIQQLEQSLIAIPEGLFSFPLQKNNKQKQQHYMEAFELMSSEVTFSMWDACYQQQYCKHLPNDYGWGRDQRPVIDVSFDEITQQFIPWLNKITAHVYALPTETQWEYAANLSLSNQFTWGNAVGNNNANCANCGSQWDNNKTAPIKSFVSNAQGFYDLNGNVWELTQDCWSTRLTKPQSNGAAWLTQGCNSGVIKGGSYMAKARNIVLSGRDWVSRDVRGKSIGFRLSRVSTTKSH